MRAGRGDDEPRRGLPRILGIGAAILLALGIATAVGDMFRTSRPAVASGGGEVRLDMRAFNFTPHAIVVEQGRSARVVLRNESVQAHTFTSPELGVDVTVEPGQSRTVTVTVPTAGQYGFYCRFHQASNMRGYVQFRA
ncbi:MAG: cupredoxin domain-containing protein [Actinomycetota bacterium]